MVTRLAWMRGCAQIDASQGYGRYAASSGGRSGCAAALWAKTVRVLWRAATYCQGTMAYLPLRSGALSAPVLGDVSQWSTISGAIRDPQ